MSWPQPVDPKQDPRIFPPPHTAQSCVGSALIGSQQNRLVRGIVVAVVVAVMVVVVVVVVVVLWWRRQQ